ncbi:EamA family transporter [Leucobacter sp. UCMA 4100]|uniref:EamA family transporter n=1 Tax=Leucobacter sp. UCMA 4100 TaxID=2810534 RepID=UPI0022EAEB2A|nr:EamA family transporter [Leucobacter sp. UCMA 4100]MDA3146806.1 EamA family transporter [Leucobacter sp. UCMA 4100]
MTHEQGTRAQASGLALVILSQLSMQFGAGIATFLFPHVGATGTVMLRLFMSTAVLFVVLRPRLRGLSRKALLAAAGLGVALASMNTLIYLAFDRIPLGAAVTFEMLGPLMLAVVLSRKLSSWLLALVAGVGVWLVSGAFPFGQGAEGAAGLDPLGVALALLAGASWAGYIVFTRATVSLFRGAEGLAVAMLFASVCIAPFMVTVDDLSAFLNPTVLLLGLVVALLSSALPYGIEQLAIRRLPTSLFAMLMSLSPVMATLAGFVLLGQSMSLVELAGITCVVTATAVALRGQAR